jgi:hypothetical protein
MLLAFAEPKGSGDTIVRAADVVALPALAPMLVCPDAVLVASPLGETVDTFGADELHATLLVKS